MFPELGLCTQGVLALTWLWVCALGEFWVFPELALGLCTQAGKVSRGCSGDKASSHRLA